MFPYSSCHKKESFISIISMASRKSRLSVIVLLLFFNIIILLFIYVVPLTLWMFSTSRMMSYYYYPLSYYEIMPFVLFSFSWGGSKMELYISISTSEPFSEMDSLLALLCLLFMLLSSRPSYLSLIIFMFECFFKLPFSFKIDLVGEICSNYWILSNLFLKLTDPPLYWLHFVSPVFTLS